MKNIDQNMFLHSSFRIRIAKFESGWPLMLDVHTIYGHSLNMRNTEISEIRIPVYITELYYIWRKHANLSSVKQLKPKTWRIFDEFDVILHHIHGNGWCSHPPVRLNFEPRQFSHPPGFVGIIFWFLQYKFFIFVKGSDFYEFFGCTSYSSYTWPCKGMKN